MARRVTAVDEGSGVVFRGRVGPTGDREGRGTLSFPDGGSVRGCFVHDTLSGPGVFTLEDGEWTEGNFVNGLLAGMVSEYDPDGALAFRGFYEDGARHGPGLVYYADGGMLAGVFLQGILGGGLNDGRTADSNSGCEGDDGSRLSAGCVGDGGTKPGGPRQRGSSSGSGSGGGGGGGDGDGTHANDSDASIGCPTTSPTVISCAYESLIELTHPCSPALFFDFALIGHGDGGQGCHETTSTRYPKKRQRTLQQNGVKLGVEKSDVVSITVCKATYTYPVVYGDLLVFARPEAIGCAMEQLHGTWSGGEMVEAQFRMWTPVAQGGGGGGGGDDGQAREWGKRPENTARAQPVNVGGSGGAGVGGRIGQVATAAHAPATATSTVALSRSSHGSSSGNSTQSTMYTLSTASSALVHVDCSAYPYDVPRRPHQTRHPDLGLGRGQGPSAKSGDGVYDRRNVSTTAAKSALAGNFSVHSSGSPDTWVYTCDIPTDTHIAADMRLPDAYEARRVCVGPADYSKHAGGSIYAGGSSPDDDDAGGSDAASVPQDPAEGLFARVQIPAETVCSWYSGIRISHETVDGRDWMYNNNTLSVDDEGVIDVPPALADGRVYCASLGHKANHSTTPNARYAPCEHPRFGPIKCIVSTQAIAPGEEITCSYDYNPSDAPDWYTRQS